eukprot:4915695-Alexandrium_andersonii.AAC.1
MEPEESEIRQVDSDLQNANDADSEEAWRAMAEGRWRWETRGAISARVSMARRVLAHDLQGNHPDS